MIAVPSAKPLTTPDVPTVATDGVEDDHVPPVAEVDSVEVAPTQTVPAPIIAGGVVLTVTLNVLAQPVDRT